MKKKMDIGKKFKENFNILENMKKLEFWGGKPPLILVARFAHTNVAEYVSRGFVDFFLIHTYSHTHTMQLYKYRFFKKQFLASKD